MAVGVGLTLPTIRRQSFLEDLTFLAPVFQPKSHFRFGSGEKSGLGLLCGKCYKIISMIRILFISTIALIAGFSGFFLYIDKHVQKQLAREFSEDIPAAYSEILRVVPDLPLTPALFKNQLLRRRYQQVDAAPKNPGEFFMEGSYFELISRPFVTPEGRQSLSSYIRYDTSSGFIENQQSPSARVFLLEPQMIAPLGSGDMRASKHADLKKIPSEVHDAVIAIEDERFYSHSGIDLTGIARALLANIRAMRIVQGGSTVTQQLAKNLFFTPEKTLGRKILEAFAALSLERRLSKEEIIELYLNEVYLGQEGSVAIHGVNEAASIFFGKEVTQLTLSESALLAGIIRAPSFYSPKRHPERALQRRDVVLRKMRQLNMIRADQLQKALDSKINIVQERFHRRTAPHYMTQLRREISSHLNLDAAMRSGLRVYTGLDIDMQACAEKALEEGLTRLEKNYPALTKGKERLEGGLFAMEPHSGKVKAWAGGRDFSRNQFDHVIQARRQMGSTVKPFVYLTALDGALNDYRTAAANTILFDRPMQIQTVSREIWEPKNFDNKFRGEVTLRYALENSLNIPAVEIGQKVGDRAIYRTLDKFRLLRNVSAVPALSLGAADTSLFDLTAAYSALSNGGIYVRPRLFVSALDGGDSRIAASTIHEARLANEDAVYVVNNLLQGALERGTGQSVRRAGYSREAAGKTGTSNDSRDAWFAGFTPNMAAGVWVGYDNNERMNLTGGVAAAPIWAEFMKCIEPYHINLSFVPPRGVVFVDIDPDTGLLADPRCSSRSTKEVFVAGTEPTISCMRERPRTAYDRGTSPSGVHDRPHDRRQAPRAREGERRSLWDMIFN